MFYSPVSGVPAIPLFCNTRATTRRFLPARPPFSLFTDLTLDQCPGANMLVKGRWACYTRKFVTYEPDLR